MSDFIIHEGEKKILFYALSQHLKELTNIEVSIKISKKTQRIITKLRVIVTRLAKSIDFEEKSKPRLEYWLNVGIVAFINKTDLEKFLQYLPKNNSNKFYKKAKSCYEKILKQEGEK